MVTTTPPTGAKLNAKILSGSIRTLRSQDMKVGRRIEWRESPAGKVWRSLSRYEHLIGVSHTSLTSLASFVLVSISHKVSPRFRHFRLWRCRETTHAFGSHCLSRLIDHSPNQLHHIRLPWIGRSSAYAYTFADSGFYLLVLDGGSYCTRSMVAQSSSQRNDFSSWKH